MEYQCTYLESFESRASYAVAKIGDRCTRLQLEYVLAVLAWICRSVRSPHRGSPFTLSSSRYKLVLNEKAAIADELFSLEIDIHDSPLLSLEHNCWQNLLIGGVVAMGEANAWRPIRLGKGLKGPFDLLFRMAAVDFATKVNDGVVFLGYQTALIPTHAGEDYVQFHLEVSNEGQINPYTLSYRNAATPDDIAFFREKECYLGWCESGNILLGTKSLPQSPKYSGAQEKPRSLVFGGISAGFQGATVAPAQIGVSAQANFVFASHRLRFTATDSFVVLLKQSAKQLAILYDFETKRAWMVPKVSLLLHMCHVWARKMLEGEEDPIPFAEPFNDVMNVVKLLGKSGDVVVCEDGDHPLTVRTLCLGFNINLLRSIQAADNSHAGGRSWYGFEFNDILYEPGRGTCMKEIKINRSGQEWLRVSRYVDALVVCSGIGEVIIPSQNIECAACGSLQKDRDYLAVPLSCMKTLMWNNGKEFPEVLLQDTQVEISEDLSWKIPTNPFGMCKHSSNGNTHNCAGWKAPEIFQHITTKKTSSLTNFIRTRIPEKKLKGKLDVSMEEVIVFGKPT
jgi:hypothetical protein